MKKLLLILLMSFTVVQIYAQSFDLDQMQQIWRPRIKADFRYLGSAKFADTSGSFSTLDQSCVITFPIKTKFSAGLELDLSSIKLKDILKNSISVKASQVMGSVKFGAKQMHMGLDSMNNRNLYYANAGVFGLKLTKKYRVLFYSVNAGFNEQQQTLKSMGLRSSGVIGQFHIRGLRKNYYYGLAAVYGDRAFIPVPFFGGTQPINDRMTFNYTLPAQMYVQYNINGKNSLSAGVTLDGYRYGMEYKNQRVNFNYASVALFTTYKVKVNKSFGFRVNGGYNAVQYVKFTEIDKTKTTYQLKPGFFVEAGFYTLFGKNLFEQIVQAIDQDGLIRMMNPDFSK
ncbi:MAG TPA: DUF6268 family outer membrane beta-barrel protein [Bacteroidia bacterium]